MVLLVYGKKLPDRDGAIYVDQSDLNLRSDLNLIKESIHAVNQITRTKVNGKRICEMFLYNDIPMWWFGHQRMIVRLSSTIGFISSFLKLIEKHNPDQVRINGDFAKVPLIQEICNVKKIRLSFSQSKYLRFRLIRNIKLALKKRLSRRIMKRRMSSRLKMFGERNVPDTRNKWLFSSYSTYRRPVFDFKTFSSKKGEFLADDIIEHLQIGKESVGIDLLGDIRISNSALSQRLSDDMPWFPAEALIGSRTAQQKEFLQYFERTIASKQFLDAFSFKGVSYGHHMLQYLRSLLLDWYMPYWLDLIDAFGAKLADARPKMIFILHEASPVSLALISACRKLGIKTAGVQHGIIHDAHPLYMHDNLFSAENPYGFILPDKLLLFGSIVKQTLLERGYPENALAVFCNPAFSGVSNIQDKLQSKNNKTVLLALPGIEGGDQKRHIAILQSLLDIALRKKMSLIVKPHPRDDPRAYERVIEEFGRDVGSVASDGIIELILSSGILVSTFSTTIMDAMCLGTLAIQVKEEDANYPSPYDGFDATLVTPLEGLEDAINKLQSDSSLQAKLRANGLRFVKQYYNIPIQDPKSVLESILDADEPNAAKD